MGTETRAQALRGAAVAKTLQYTKGNAPPKSPADSSTHPLKAGCVGEKKAHDRYCDHGLLNDSVLFFYFRLTLDPPQASSKAHGREPHGGISWTETTPAP